MINRFLRSICYFYYVVQTPVIWGQGIGVSSKGLGYSVIGTSPNWSLASNPSLIMDSKESWGLEFGNTYGLSDLHSLNGNVLLYKGSFNVGALLTYHGIKEHHTKAVVLGAAIKSSHAQFGVGVGYTNYSIIGQEREAIISLVIGLKQSLSNSVSIGSSIYNIQSATLFQNGPRREKVALGMEVQLNDHLKVYPEFEYSSGDHRGLARIGMKYFVKQSFDAMVGYEGEGSRLSFSGILYSKSIKYGFNIGYHSFLGLSPAFCFSK